MAKNNRGSKKIRRERDPEDARELLQSSSHDVDEYLEEKYGTKKPVLKIDQEETTPRLRQQQRLEQRQRSSRKKPKKEDRK